MKSKIIIHTKKSDTNHDYLMKVSSFDETTLSQVTIYINSLNESIITDFYDTKYVKSIDIHIEKIIQKFTLRHS